MRTVGPVILAVICGGLGIWVLHSGHRFDALVWLATVAIAIQLAVLAYCVGKDGPFDGKVTKKIESIVVCTAALGALYALDIYTQTNVISTRMALEQRDASARMPYFSADSVGVGTKLMEVFFTDPALDELEYSTCEKSTQDKILAWAKGILGATTTASGAKQIPEWQNVRELYDTLFDAKTRNLDGMNDVRRAFFHLVDYAYIVQDAYNAKARDVFDEEEYDMWAAYVDDLGPSPIFMMVVMDGQESGYFTKSFGRELRNRYEKNPRLNCVARVLYPELASDEKTWDATWEKYRHAGLPAAASPATGRSGRGATR